MSRMLLTTALVVILSVPAMAQQTLRPSNAEGKVLSELIDAYFKAWDSPDLSDKGMIEISEKLFEHGPDFAMVIDASYYPSWNERLQKIPQKVAEFKAEEQGNSSCRTLDERIQFVAKDAAVLTRFYRHTFTETGGKRGHQDSAVTILFMRKAETWKIVQYHGSHGARVYD